MLAVKANTGKDEKLLFLLCLKCSKQDIQQKCSHTREERQFVGTWSTVKVNKALEVGYEIKEIPKVWHFEHSKELWRGYISKFMKIKLETSPHNYTSDLKYVQAIRKELGIDLEIAKLAPNPGKRAVAKICLNSLLGKFGQRSNLGNTNFVGDPARFYNILLMINLQTYT